METWLNARNSNDNKPHILCSSPLYVKLLFVALNHSHGPIFRFSTIIQTNTAKYKDVYSGNSLKEAYTPENSVKIIHSGVLDLGAANVAIISRHEYEQTAAPVTKCIELKGSLKGNAHKGGTLSIGQM